MVRLVNAQVGERSKQSREIEGENEQIARLGCAIHSRYHKYEGTLIVTKQVQLFALLLLLLLLLLFQQRPKTNEIRCGDSAAHAEKNNCATNDDDDQKKMIVNKWQIHKQTVRMVVGLLLVKSKK